jgi:hypothetical protein
MATGAAAPSSSSDNPQYYNWKPIRIGAGGWLTGIDIAPDGTKVVRADTYGAYVWDAAEWRQLVTSDSMPAEEVAVIGGGTGVYEIRIAPSNTQRFYMFYRGCVYRSDDRGRHWKRTSFAQDAAADANDEFRTLGEKMAVDPANPDVVYVGTPNAGVFVTTDGGKKWQSVSAIPVSAKEHPGGADQPAPGHAGIAFDSSSGLMGGRTKVIYIPSWGNGIWRSEDAGASWTQISGGDKVGGTSKVRHAAVSSTGVYYVTTAVQGRDQSGVWAYSSGVWKGIYPGGKDTHSLALDPGDSEHIIIGDEGGRVAQSFDGGKTWTDTYWNFKLVATDVPWLAWTNEPWLSSGGMLIDPATHELFFSEGIGVWKATLPKTAAPFDWISQSKGIEQLCSLVVTAPPGGKPVLGSMDRPLWYVENPDVYPSTHGPNKEHTLIVGYSIDYASSDPKFLAAIVNFNAARKDDESCYSTDGGKSWTKFPTLPNWPVWPVNGCIAASTPLNIVWGPSDKKPPYYTQDGGKTWVKISIPGIAEDDAGWSWVHWFNRQQVAADRVTLGTFYMYHMVKGLYRSTDGGVNWELVHQGELSPYSGFHAKLKSVPCRAGHLFFTAGTQGAATDKHPVSFCKFLHSKDAGVTWTDVPNVLEVVAFGFGKDAPGGKYPTLYIAGWVKNEWGIWESDDEATTWKKIGDFPTGSLAGITAIDGDKTEYGKVYVGLSGDGWAYGVRSE